MIHGCGTKPGKGRYICVRCGDDLYLNQDTDVLPPCARCHGCKFSREAVFTGIVIRVVAGDRITVEDPRGRHIMIRLLGIDCPQIGYGGMPGQKPWAEAARLFSLQQLFGQEVRLAMDEEKKDKCQRLLAFVFRLRDNKFLNLELLRTGNACMYAIYPNLEHFADFRQGMMEAKAGGRGVWHPNYPLPELPMEYRIRLFGKKPHKYVGDWTTMKYYDPTDYYKVPEENRIFFFEKGDAEKARFNPV